MTDISNEAEKSEVITRLHELIKNMSKDEQQTLLDELEARLIEKKRKYERKAFHATIDYSTETRSYRDFIKDISHGGVFIETSTSFSIGEIISMTLLLPKYDKKIKIKGEIVRIDKQGIGVSFKASQIQKEIVQSFVDSI